MLKVCPLAKKIFISLFLLPHFYLAADSWTLAAQKFSFKQKGMDSSSNSQIAQVLPQLILEQISNQSIRTLPSREQMDRELNELLTSRLSLFLQLSKENKTRDALVLSKDKPSQLKKALREQDKKILEIETKIDENISSLIEVKNKYKDKIAFENGEEEKRSEDDRERFRPFPFFHGQERQERKTETVVLYKNDSSQLFTPGSDAVKDGIKSYTYNKEVTQSKINGLLTGEITVYGEYFSVSVNLYVFPGGFLKCNCY